MISERLLDLAQCPDCGGRLAGTPGTPECAGCARRFRCANGDYLDLRPAAVFPETTRYLDETLHADARHETVSPPLLSAAIRNDLLRRFLRPASGDTVLDLGCGSGRTLVWNQRTRAHMVGIDVSPFFAVEARAGADLVLGDLRRLPFRDGSFAKAYALDVLEHLSPDALREMLREAARVLAPGGTLFVYSHVRKNSPLAFGLRAINMAARQLERAGLIDMTQERLRKSDHLNPLADIPELERVVAAAGFRIARIRYYTPLIGGFVENIVIRLAEHQFARRARRQLMTGHAAQGSAPDQASILRAARTAGKRQVDRRGATYLILQALTRLMKLDLLLFGRIRSGPFFALLERM